MILTECTRRTHISLLKRLNIRLLILFMYIIHRLGTDMAFFEFLPGQNQRQFCKSEPFGKVPNHFKESIILILFING